MSKEYEFLKECGAFFVLTADGDKPAGRPFGAIAEHDGDLFIATSAGKEVYRQMTENGNVQLLALKSGTRAWIRVDGVATECRDSETKEQMMRDCPVLTKHYASYSDPNFNVFRIRVTGSEMR